VPKTSSPPSPPNAASIQFLATLIFSLKAFGAPLYNMAEGLAIGCRKPKRRTIGEQFRAIAFSERQKKLAFSCVFS
jgi:hypothetical protein